MKKPEVDILLAAYNGEKYLPRQLDSLRRQLHTDFRVVMHDDGSTDGTPALLAQAMKDDSRFVMAGCRETHLGAAGSFLALLREGDGPCCLCDQDDVWTPDHVHALLQDLREMEKQVGPETPLLVMSDCAVTDSEGALLHASLCMHQGWQRRALPLTMLLVSNNATGCTMLLNGPLRRLVAEHARGEGIFMHDWFIAQTAACFGAAYFEPLPLVNYRQHGSNALGASRSSLPARALSMLKQRDKVKERLSRSYREAEAFMRCYDKLLTGDARKAVEDYLATEAMTGRRRRRALKKGGYVMQNLPARLAQFYLG